MRHLIRKWNPLLLSPLLALALMQCQPGKSLDATPPVNTPTADSGKVAKIDVVSAPATLLPTDTGTVQLTITDSASGGNMKGALIIASSSFSLLSASSSDKLSLDSVPVDGRVSFRIFSSTPGNGSVTVQVNSGGKVRSKSVAVIITEKPVAPLIVETLPKSVVAKETTSVAFTIVDSAQQKPLPNAVVTVSSPLYEILSPTKADTLYTDTTHSDGKVNYRVYSASAGAAGTLQVKVKTAAGLLRTQTFTLMVAADSVPDRPRKMVFTALRSSLRADGTDSTQLTVLVKDDNNNPMTGETLHFTSTGGVVKATATTDVWGVATTVLRSERVNKTVVVTATLDKTGATAQQSVSFDGVTININPQKRVLMADSLDPITFQLLDGGNTPMSGDTVELTARGALKGFGGNGPDSIVVVTDTKGQYQTFITSHQQQNIVIVARALGAKSTDTVSYTTNSMTLASSKAFIMGDGVDSTTMTVTLKDGSNAAMAGKQLRWSTTFGSFTTTPFTNTDGNGQSTIHLRSARGSGLATVNVEASDFNGTTRSLIASGNLTVPVRALRVAKLVLKVTPDNIPVKTGEAQLIAQAFDSSDNYMTGVLVGFRMIKGAGGGDEVISPPIDYTQSGTAQSVFHAGGVISLYRSVKLAAVALDVRGTDTAVIASSDTLSLTVSGPPYRVSVGVNILKGENPNDGTFALPTAAVVTDVNGNFVADGTPVNYSTTPIGALYFGESWKPTDTWPYYTLGDTVWYTLPWTDYNNNGKLDVDEEPSAFDLTHSHPARGEDLDGDGVINTPPETFEDINHNGVWDSANAEPLIQAPPTDTSGKQLFVDFNKNGKRDTVEPFYRNGKWITDLSQGPCKCAGQRDASGHLYENTYFGSSPNHPFPGEVSVGVPRTVPTVDGKSPTKIVYVQSLARVVQVRITAESNGIRSSVDVVLPIVKDN